MWHVKIFFISKKKKKLKNELLGLNHETASENFFREACFEQKVVYVTFYNCYNRPYTKNDFQRSQSFRIATKEFENNLK